MQHCGSPAKCMTLPNSLGKYLQLSTKKGEMPALIFRLALTEWSIVLLLCIYSKYSVMAYSIDNCTIVLCSTKAAYLVLLSVVCCSYKPSSSK